MEKGAPRLEHPCQVLVERGTVHVRGLTQRTRGRIVYHSREFTVLETFHQLMEHVVVPKRLNERE